MAKDISIYCEGESIMNLYECTCGCGCNNTTDDYVCNNCKAGICRSLKK